MTLTQSFRKRKDVKQGYREEIRISCKPKTSLERFVQAIGYKVYREGSAVSGDGGEVVRNESQEKGKNLGSDQGHRERPRLGTVGNCLKQCDL